MHDNIFQSNSKIKNLIWLLKGRNFKVKRLHNWLALLFIPVLVIAYTEETFPSPHRFILLLHCTTDFSAFVAFALVEFYFKMSASFEFFLHTCKGFSLKLYKLLLAAEIERYFFATVVQTAEEVEIERKRIVSCVVKSVKVVKHNAQFGLSIFELKLAQVLQQR